MLSAREKNQDAAKRAIRKSFYNGSIIMSVGAGKGKVMLDLAVELVEKGAVKTILYLCDNRRLRDSEEEGFPGELAKWAPNLENRIVFECYQTCFRHTGRTFDLLLADECDYAITPQYIKGILLNNFKYKILVSGTLSNEKKEVLEKIAPIVYTCDTTQAENKGIINKSDYYLYKFKMTQGESINYQNINKKISTLVMMGCGFEDKEYVFWLRTRKRFLNSLESSANHCRKILRYFYNADKTNRFVIFCELTEQADKVCKYSFHGKNEHDDNLTLFQEGKINALSVVAKIKRGINLKRANIAIHEGISSSSTEWEQRAGRFKRLDINETATIVFMLPYFLNKEGEWKPTAVKKWINKATHNISNLELKPLII